MMTMSSGCSRCEIAEPKSKISDGSTFKVNVER